MIEVNVALSAENLLKERWRCPYIVILAYHVV